MYTLVTRNKVNFDERGRSVNFSDGTDAILAARRFIKSATCAGAEATIFGPHGETVFALRPAPKVSLKWMAPGLWEVMDPFGDLAGQFTSKRSAIWFIRSQGWEVAKVLKNPADDQPKCEWKKYVVHVTWRDPAWDEKDGADIETEARSKADACKYVRRQMRDGGHTGVMYFKATEIPQ